MVAPCVLSFQQTLRIRSEFKFALEGACASVCSELLEEDREPLEVLPGGCIGPSLLVTLRVLLADDMEFFSWRTLDDALHQCSGPPPEAENVWKPQQQSSLEGGSAQQPNGAHQSCEGQQCCGSRSRVRKLTGGQPEASRELPRPKRLKGGAEADASGHGAVSTRTDGYGGLPDGINGSSAVEATAAGVVQKAVREDQAQLGNTSIEAAAPETLTSTMCLALSRCIQLRLQRYRSAALAEDVEALEREEGQSGQKSSRREGSRARVAAMRLVVAEKHILHAALQAIACRRW